MMKYILAIFLCGFSVMANANSGFLRTTINSVIIHDFGNQILVSVPEPGITNSEGCSNNKMLVVEKTHPFFNQIYAALLAVYQSGGGIQGWVNGCNSTFGAPILTRLDLVKY